MSGRSDRPSGESGDQKHADGISALDLESLPSTLRSIMRLMLREIEMTYSDLCEAVDRFPEPDRLSRADLDEVLESLVRQRWLIRIDTDQATTYKVNLRRKPPSSLSKNIWDAIDSGSESSR